jgi:hypothetical protein
VPVFFRDVAAVLEDEADALRGAALWLRTADAGWDVTGFFLVGVAAGNRAALNRSAAVAVMIRMTRKPLFYLEIGVA